MTDQNISQAPTASVVDMKTAIDLGTGKAGMPVEPKSKAPSRFNTVKKLLGRAKGASIAEIMAATGWQPHSARAFLSGLRKKGVTLLRESRKDGETSYRIAS